MIGDVVFMKFRIEWLRITPFIVAKRLLRLILSVFAKPYSFITARSSVGENAVETTNLFKNLSLPYLLLYVNADTLVLCLR